MGKSASSVVQPALNQLDSYPDVLFIAHLGAILGSSTRTIARRLDAGTFPIKPLPSIDRKLRWSKSTVLAFLNGRTR